VIAFLTATNIQVLAAARGLGIKTLVSERNDPALQLPKPPWDRFRRMFYPSADLVTANSAGALANMKDYVPENKLRQVANPVVVPTPMTPLADRLPRVIYLGRLVAQKAPDVLLKAFAQNARRWPAWHLDIVGEGPLRCSLQSLADELGIAERCHFLGHLSDPYPLLQQAAVFALPSRFEGMPNAMLEAMACGLAVIVSNASPGPLELIQSETSGLTFEVDNVDDLARGLARLIEDAALRQRLAHSGQLRAIEMSLPAVAARWESLLGELGVKLTRRTRSRPK
jgi:glycosyltransferase involved in cell wall biosynthesis